jgi:hypothetical protein
MLRYWYENERLGDVIIASDTFDLWPTHYAPAEGYGQERDGKKETHAPSFNFLPLDSIDSTGGCNGVQKIATTLD